MTTADAISRHLEQRYARQGYDVTETHLTAARFGWIFEADLGAGGTRYRLTATGRAFGVTSETISPADADPFTPQICDPREARL